MVIGSGGGTDVQTALHWGAGEVTAIEINSSTIKAVKGPFAAPLQWPLDKRVALVNEDGRSFVKRVSKQYDVIQLSGVDTLTLNATGALNMVEEYLYTVEAFEDYLSVLKEDGVLAVIRFNVEYIRLVALATEALLRQGITDPQNHIAIFQQSILSSIIVSKSKFTDSQIASIIAVTSRTAPNRVHIPLYEGFDLYLNNPITLIYLPGHRTAPEIKFFFDTVATSATGRQKQFRAKGVTDDKPFFMFSGLLSTRIEDLPLKIRNNLALFKQFWVATILFALVCWCP